MTRDVPTNPLQDARKFGLILAFMIEVIFDLFRVLLLKGIPSDSPRIVAICFLLVAVVSPRLLVPIRKYWILLGERLGEINSKIILFVLYFLMIFPIGFILKILNKQSIKRKWQKDTYWERRSQTYNPHHMKEPY